MLNRKNSLRWILFLFLWNNGCSSFNETGVMVNQYQEALNRTDPKKYQKLSLPKEQEAMERFTALFSNFNETYVKEKVQEVYADDAYFNDTLKTVSGAQEIETYLLESLEAAEEVVVEVQDVAESNGNYYFRWVMQIKFKSLKKGQVCSSIGMSHIRFNENGKIVLHQDYWDSAAGLFEHIPVVGWMIGKIKNRF